MNSKIAMSGLSILASLAVMGGATFAFFSDSATSSANTFTSGTLNLLLDDAANPTPVETLTGTFVVNNFIPGQTDSKYISLHNPTGNITMEKIKFGVNATFDDGPDNLGDIRDVLNLQVTLDDGTPDTACLGGTSLTADMDAEVGDNATPLTVKEFNSGADDEFDAIFEGAPQLLAGQTRNLCISVQFDPGAGDIYQGDSATAAFNFVAQQDESQI